MSDETFSGFGKKFQESLAQLIFDERAFADQIGEVLDYNFFELKFHKEFVEKVYEYKKRYEVHPTKDIFSSFLRTEYDTDDLVSEQVKHFFERIKNQPIQDIMFIKEKAVQFCKNQKIKEAILKSVELMGDQEYEQIEKIVREAVNLGLENDAGHDYKEDFAKRYSDDYRGNVVPTGWKQLNSCMDGGLAQGETGVIIAPTGTGKSWILAHLGASALKAGKNVVHFIMELNESKMGRRYDSILTTIPLDDLKQMKHNVWNVIKDVDAHLEIVKFPPNRITMNTIINRIEKIKKRSRNAFQPDLIIVDYGDLINPTGEFNSKVDALQSVFEDLQRMAEEFNVPVWTATQTNRSGFRSEVIELDQVADAYAKCFRANFIATISRRPEDIQANTGRFFIGKNNLGRDKVVFPMYMDTFGTCKIDLLSEQSYEEPEAPNVKAQQSALNNLIKQRTMRNT